MILFEGRADGTAVASFTQLESDLIGSLAQEIVGLLDGVASPPRVGEPETVALFESVGIGGSLSIHSDPAIARLLPDAYSDDAEAARDFRGLTERSLASRKVSNARVVLASLESSSPEVVLSPAEIQAWMRTLTDIRLALATRLGIETEYDRPADDDENGLVMRDVYDWLSVVLESLIEAVDQ